MMLIKRERRKSMGTIIDGTDHVTAAEAADELATTIPRILMLLRDKVLSGTRVNGEWYVASDSLTGGKTLGREMQEVRGCARSCSASSCGCR
jgi:hypothetical protein